MAYKKYYLYKKQVSYDQGETWEDTGEYVPSGDPIGYYDTYEDCIAHYRTVSTGRTCSGTHGVDLYQLVEYQASYDEGITWTTISSTTGSLIEANSSACGYRTRTTSGTAYCTGYDKYQDVYSQVSYDNGNTWTTTATTPTLIEADSPDCGYVPPTPCECSAFTFDATSHTITDTSQSVTFNYSGCTKPDLSSASTYGWMLIANHVYNAETTVGYITANVSANTSSARTGILYTSLSGSTCQNLVISQQAPTPTPTSAKYVLTLNDSSTVSAECDSTSSVTSGEVATQYSGSVVSATIGECVTSIDRLAFDGCHNLTSVNIPSGVTSINICAFRGCTSLTSVTIPDSVEIIDMVVFKNCSGLTNVTIGSGVTSIGGGAFENCTSLTSITIPSGVTSIGIEVFNNCSSLTSVSIPSGVIRIVERAFSHCGLTGITIPDSVTYIGHGAFSYCNGLTSVTIPNSVTYIGRYAFSGCTSLTSITVEATTPPTLESYGGYTSFDNTNNCPIYVPCASVDTYKAASGWSTYASRIEGIPPCGSPTPSYKWLATYTGGTTSSAQCDSTSAITEDEINVANLAEIQIGNCVTTIDASVFYDLSWLTGVTIGSGITSIGNKAFFNCANLQSITINAVTPPTVGTQAFILTTCPIYVPANSVDTYKAASGWSTYASRIQAIP